MNQFQKIALTEKTRRLIFFHVDILEPVTPVPVDNHRYAISFVDSFFRYRKVYFIKTRDDWLQYFQQICADLDLPQTLKSDCAKELYSSQLSRFCRENKMRLRENSVPYTQSGDEMGDYYRHDKTLLDNAGSGKEYWTYAMNSAFYIKNCNFHSAVRKRAHEKMYGSKPNVVFCKSFRLLGLQLHWKTILSGN